MRKFTLIEIVVVMLIILIVACITIPAISFLWKSQSVSSVEKKNDEKNNPIIVFSSIYGDCVYKFEYDGEAYLTSNRGGIIHIEKHQTGENK
jgi:hypothetical protein